MARAAPRQKPKRNYFAPALAGLLGLAVGAIFTSNVTSPDLSSQPPSAGEVMQQTVDPSKLAYLNEQQKAELKLLKDALIAAAEVDGHHRHHSQVMWDLLEGKITSREAWWQGGDSTCAGWLAAGRYEKAIAKLQGRIIKPPPIPKQGLEFCKLARERR